MLYTKQIVSIKDYELAIQRKIKRVKELKTTSLISPWVVDSRPAGYDAIHEEDNISNLKHVGKIAIKKFNLHDIHTVGDIKRMTDQEATALHTTAKIAKFDAIRTTASTAAPGSNPYPVIHYATSNLDGTPTTNPYHARFGSNWRDAISKSTALSSIVCITSLIQYMMTESARVMADTVHSKDWYFYHDALSLMTANQTRQWMKETSIGGENRMDKWLVPIFGCNTNTPSEHRFVGN